MNLYLSRGQHTVDSAFYDKIQAIIYSTELKEVDRSFDEEDVLTLFKAIDELKKELALVKLENEVLEHFLELNDPAQLAAIRERERGTRKQIKITFALEPDDGRRSILSRMSKIGASFYNDDAGYTSARGSINRPRRDMSASTYPRESVKNDSSINYVMKRELVEKLCVQIEDKMKNFEKSGMRELIRLAASRKELKLRITEVEETASSFEEIVVNKKQGTWAFKIPSERFSRYCESWSRNGAVLISTMRIKNNALSRQWMQQKASLVRKMDLSGALMPVDFKLMDIRRDNYRKIIDDKTKHLLNLKKQSGQVSLNLTTQRKILMVLENSLRAINYEVEVTKRYIGEVHRETLEVEKEIEKSRDSLAKLTKQLEVYEAPSIKSYIKKKQQLQSIQKEEKLLQRQNYIIGIKLQNTRKKFTHEKEQRRAYK